MNTYTPLPGSVAERAYEYLRRHIGEWIPNAQMTEAFNCDGSSIIQSLRTALDRKLIERRNEGRLVVWRMPKVACAPGEEPDDEPPMQRTVPAPARDPALTGGLLRVRSAFDLAPRLAGMPPLEDDDGECRNLDAPPLLAAAPSVPKPRLTASEVLARQTRTQQPGPAPSLRIALWSDGELVIDRCGDVVRFDRNETRAIVNYLERLAVEEGA
jgi:hypothetical protein